MRIATASAKPRNDVVSDGERNDVVSDGERYDVVWKRQRDDVRDDLMMGPTTWNVMKTKTNKSQRLVMREAGFLFM